MSTTTFERDVATTSQRTVINAGVIGVGFIGEVHVRAIRAAGGVVHAIAAGTIQESRVAATKLGVAKALTTDEIISDPSIDVIHICTPNVFHAELAEKAIRAGKSVVCEKPLAISVEEAQKLSDLAREFGVIASIPFVYRYYPSVQEAKDRIKNLREPLNLLHGYYLQDWLSREKTVNWRIDPKLGGPSRAFADIGVHWCDLVEYVTGHKIVRLNAQLMKVFNSRGEYAKVDTEDGATILFQTDLGAHGSLVLSQVSAGHKNKLWFSCESPTESFVFNQESPDSLWVGGLESNQTVARGVAEESESAKRFSILPAGHPQGFQDCFNAFVSDSYSALSGANSDVLPSFEDGLRATQLTDAVLRSAQSNSWVNVK